MLIQPPPLTRSSQALTRTTCPHGHAGLRDRIGFGEPIGSYISRDGDSFPASIEIVHYQAPRSVIDRAEPVHAPQADWYIRTVTSGHSEWLHQSRWVMPEC